MFPAKPRPVPSKAALKVLYQLAYITSGTAVGVATLCLEERRRQLKLVQRIADNAKRLRQSPRYYQNVALAEHHPEVERRLEKVEHEDIKGPELPSIVEREYHRIDVREDGQSSKRRVRARKGCNEDHIRADPWPHESSPHVSYVPFSGSQMHGSRTKLVTTASEGKVPNTDKFQQNELRNGKQGLEQITEQARSATRTDLNLLPPDQGSPRVRLKRTKTTLPTKAYKSLQLGNIPNAPLVIQDNSEQSILQKVAAAPVNSEDVKSSPEFSTTVIVHDSEPSPPAREDHSKTREANGGPTKLEPVAPADFSSDIDLLLASGTGWHRSSAVSSPDQPWIDKAEDLLLKALRLGLWSHVVKLGRCMDESNVLDAAHGYSILAALISSRTHEQTPVDALINTCQEVFALRPFRSKPTSQKYEHIIEMMLSQFKTTGKEAMKDGGRFTNARLSCNQTFAAGLLPIAAPRGLPLQGPSDADKLILAGILLARAREFLELNRYFDALDIISACGFSLEFGDSTGSLTLLLNQAFHAALDSYELETCAVLLRIEAWNSEVSGFAQKRDIFLRTCDQTRQYSLVEQLFVDQETMIDPRFTDQDEDDDGLAVLALAAARSPALLSPASPSPATLTEQMARDRFVGYYYRLSQRLRQRVAKDYALSDVMGNWAISQDASTTMNRLRVLEDDLGNDDPGAARAVLLAQLDVHIRQNDHEMARVTLTRLHESDRADHDTLGRAALMLAKENKWRHLDELLKLAKQSKILRFGPAYITKLNAVISVFSRGHTPEETWSFVESWIYDYKFVPNQATTEILLGAFVSGKSYDLIPCWLRHLRTMGIYFEFNADIVVKLLTRFYRENRPSHELIIFACENLSKYSPSLAGPGYLRLISEAVGFDIRSFSGLQHAATKTAAAQARLRSVSFLPRNLSDVEASVNLSMDRLSQYGSVQLQHGTKPNKQAEIPERTSGNYVSLRDPPGLDIGSTAPESYQVPSPTATHDLPTTYATTSEDSSLSLNDYEPESDDALDDWAANFNNLRASYKPPIPERSMEPPKPERSMKPPIPERSMKPPKPKHSMKPPKPKHSMKPPIPERSIETPIPERSIESPLPERPIETPLPERPIETLIPERSIELENDRQAHEKHKTPVKSMILALSLKQNDQVLDMYHKSLDRAGRPASPLVLEVAVEASLRLNHGNTGPAEAIMMRAREAGMNAACGMGPLLIHQIRNFGREGRKNGSGLRDTVLRYYSLNEKLGLPVKHVVATTAASVLVQGHCPQDAVLILEGIHRSEWAQKQPMDLAAMTVFVRAYAALGDVRGIQWVVDTVLARDMRIDRKFVHELKQVCNPTTRGNGQPKFHGKDAEVLSAARVLCMERRADQRLETQKLGSRLASVLANCANQANNEKVYIDRWPDDQKASFDAAADPLSRSNHAIPQERQASKDSDNGSGPDYSHLLAVSSAQQSHLTEDSDFRQRRTDRPSPGPWRQDIITPDGKLISFRKVVDPMGATDAIWHERKRTTWRTRKASWQYHHRDELKR